MSLRTPLGKVLGRGSAKEGTDHFWRQRLTAVANVPLTLIVIWLIVSLAGAGHGEVVATLSSPLVAIALLLFVASAVTHMRLGLQVVIEDYVHQEGLKIAALMLNTFVSAAIAITAGFAILKLGFGG